MAKERYMKLKEKLAYDFLDERSDPRYPYNNDYADGLVVGFVAGFDEAMRIASLFFSNSWQNPKYTHRKTTPSLIHEIGCDVTKLGEEEVQ